MSVADLLLERALVSPVALDRASERQLSLGLDLGTLLLYDGVLEEGALHELLAEHYELPRGPSGRLPGLEPELAALVPPALVRRFRAFPYRVTRRTAHVATSGPLEGDVERELRNLLGLQLKVELVTPHRLAEALHRYAGVPLTEAVRALLERLGEGAVSPSSCGSHERAGAAHDDAPASYRRISEHPRGVRPSRRQPRRPTVPPVSVRPRGGDAPLPATLRPSERLNSPTDALGATLPPGTSLPPEAPCSLSREARWRGDAGMPRQSAPPAPSDATTVPPSDAFDNARVLDAAADGSSSQAATPEGEGMPGSIRGEDLALSLGPAEQRPKPSVRHKGPLVRERALAALEAAHDVNDVLELVLRYARQYFERVAVLVVAHGTARVRGAYGLPLASSVTLALDGDGVLARAVAERRTVVGPLEEHGGDDSLLALAASHASLPAAVIPLAIGARVVALVYGDDEGAAIDDAAVKSVGDVTRAASDALARLLATRKNTKAD